VQTEVLLQRAEHKAQAMNGMRKENFVNVTERN